MTSRASAKDGRLTPDGEFCVFRTGIQQIIQRTPAPVVPMALLGLWSSALSRKGGRPCPVYQGGHGFP